MLQHNLGHGDDQLDRAFEAAQPTEAEMDAMYARHLIERPTSIDAGIAAGEIGYLEEVGKSQLICDVCDMVAWDGGVDGDACPVCVEKWEAKHAAN